MMERKKHRVLTTREDGLITSKINQWGDPGNMTNENLRMKLCLAVRVVWVGRTHMITIFT